MHRGPPRGRDHHLAGGVVLDPLPRPRIGQHRGGVIALREGEWRDRGGHREVNSTTEHRHPPATRNPLWERVPVATDVHGKWVPNRLAKRRRSPAGNRSHTTRGNPIPS